MVTTRSEYRPAWLTARIVANTRKAHLASCTCGQPILVGLDDDQCAFNANADITPLTWAGELAATHIEARATYEYAAGELWRRHPHRQLEASTHPILPAHRCGQPVPDTWTKPTQTIRRREDTNEPPF